jgi:hypothetical protein
VTVGAGAALLAIWLAGGAGVGPRASGFGLEEIERLEGQKVTIAADGSYTIDDIANEGPPRVGIVERSGRALWLCEAGRAVRLDGPLAIPRIAGPGYKVWVIGDVDGDRLWARRIGVLRGPARRGQGTSASTTSVAPKPCTSAPPGT